MKKLLLTAITVLSIHFCNAQIDYFGQTPPGNTAEIFAPGIISKSDRLEDAGIYSPDGKEFYFCIASPAWDVLNTYVVKYIDDHWSSEALASFSSIAGGARGTYFNKQNSIVFFVSSSQEYTTDGYLKTDFWFAKRNGTDWDSPKKLNAEINDIGPQWHLSISDSGHIYFGSRGSVFVADQINDTTFGEPVKLNDNNINFAGSINTEPYVAADESYLIFHSDRSGGYGVNDLYITYKKNNTWTNPKNLGPGINSALYDLSPKITPDGKYLIFSRTNGINSRDIYWASASFIDSLKTTNFAPYVKYRIPDHTIQIDSLFEYILPDSTFFDDDGNETLTLTIDTELPEWLKYNPVTKTFSGLPNAKENLSVTITATDTAGVSVSDIFRINVIDITGISNVSAEKFKIYPNPVSGQFTITFGSTMQAWVFIEIFNTEGKLVLRKTFHHTAIASIDLTGNPDGMYLCRILYNEYSSYFKLYKQ